MCNNNILFFKTWTLVFYVYYVTNNPILQAMKTESFTESQRLLAYIEGTALTLVCHPSNTSDWAAILHENKVLVNSSKSSSIISYTFPSLSCKDFGQYFCVTNTTQHMNVSVVGCTPQLCLPPYDKLLKADLGQDFMFDVCVMVPAPLTGIPLKVSYNNTWLDNGHCVSRLCVTWTNVTMYRINVKITISEVSEEDYGEMKFKFGTSYAYENYSVSYFPVLIPIAMKTENFTESPRHLGYPEKTALMLVCHPPDTSDWAAILHEDKVLVNRSKSSTILSYTFPSLSCKDFGQYFCVTNTTQYMNVSVIGCPPQLCLPHDKLLKADLGQDFMFDACVMVPAPLTGIPLKVSYNNIWLDNGTCVSRLFVTWTNVEFYRFNVKITISDVSEEDYGEMELKFGTSYIYENYSVNYFPVLIPRSTNDSNDRNNAGESLKYMIASIILVLFCIIGCGLLCFKKVSETDHDYLSVYDFCPEQNPELSMEHHYNDNSVTANPRNLYDDIQDTSQNARHLNLVDDYITVV